MIGSDMNCQLDSWLTFCILPVMADRRGYMTQLCWPPQLAARHGTNRTCSLGIALLIVVCMLETSMKLSTS